MAQQTSDLKRVLAIHNISDPDWVAFIVSNAIAVTKTLQVQKHSQVGTGLNHVDTPPIPLASLTSV